MFSAMEDIESEYADTHDWPNSSILISDGYCKNRWHSYRLSNPKKRCKHRMKLIQVKATRGQDELGLNWKYRCPHSGLTNKGFVLTRLYFQYPVNQIS